MPWSSIVAAVAPSLISGLFGDSGGSPSAGYSNQASDQLAAARLAAEAAKFRPVGITTRFGSSNFQFGIPGVNPPKQSDYQTPEEFAAAQSDYQNRLRSEGVLTGAGYELSPELKAYQDRLMSLSGGGLTQAEEAQKKLQPLSTAATGLFNLGQQYLAQNPQEVASKYMQQQQDLLAPSRERQMAQLQNQLFQQGRGGLSVGATGARPSGAAGLGATTPEMEAYYNALAQQDAQLAAQAQQAGQQNVAFGTGLFNTGNNLLGNYYSGQVNALNPFTTYLGAGSTLESLGQQPLDIGAQLGGRTATAGANAGQSLLTGGLAAAQSNLNAARNSSSALLNTGLTSLVQNPQFQSGISNFFNPYVPNTTAFNYGPSYEFSAGAPVTMF